MLPEVILSSVSEVGTYLLFARLHLFHQGGKTRAGAQVKKQFKSRF